MSSRQLRTTVAYGRLSAALTSGATSATVTLLTGAWPDNPPFYLALGDGTERYEVVTVTATTGSTLTITRAQQGTLAVAHPQDESVTVGPTDLEAARLLGYSATATPSTSSANLVSLVDLFGPPSVPGLVRWFAVDRITGLADAAAVSSWADLSGNAGHAVQATGAQQPTYRTGIVNSLPAVLFDGSDWLATPVFAGALETSTIFAVAKANVFTGNRNVVDGTLGGRHQLGVRASAWQSHQGSGNNAGPAADTNWHVLAGIYSATTGSFVAVDGTAAAASNSGTNSLARLWIGASSSANEFWSGYVAEVIVYSGALTTAQRRQVEWHLATKYGLATASTFDPDQQAATATRAAQLSVADRGLWVSTSGSDSNDGLSGGSAKATVQAALTALGTTGGVVTVLGGTHTQTAELSVGEGPVTLRGMGSGLARYASRLYWPTDLGAGTFGIKHSVSGATEGIVIEDLWLEGPDSTITLGGAGAAAMRGIRLNRRMTVRDCRIKGFHSGINIVQDHNKVIRCEISNCVYGLYFSDMTTWGDHYLDDNSITGLAMASIGIAPDGKVLGTNITHGHLGISPYAIYMEPGRDPSGDCFSSVNFHTVSIEWCGNGIIVSPDQTAFSTWVTMTNCGTMSIDQTWKIAGVDYEAPIVLGTMNSHVWTSTPGTGLEAGSLPTVASLVWAKTFQNNLFISPRWHSLLSDKEAVGGPEVFVVDGGTNCGGNRWYDGSRRGTISRVHPSSGNVVQGQVVAWTHDDKVYANAAAYTANNHAKLAGVALNDAPANNTAAQAAAMVVLEGTGIRTNVTAAPAGGAQVMVDPADRDKAVTADGRLDAQHLGFLSSNQTGVTAGTNANVDLHIAQEQAVQRKTVTGSRDGNAALADLLTELAALGIITDSSSA